MIPLLGKIPFLYLPEIEESIDPPSSCLVEQDYPRKKKDAAIADIVYPILFPNASWLGIVCTGRGEMDKEMTNNILEIIFGKLYEMADPKKMNVLLKEGNYDVCQADENLLGDKIGLRKLLKKEFRF